ncbi:alcohol dehydrogenase catalytic domain-containing protein [Conexibacter sp. JD483]|uniref:zinc-dependent alcohol dehydrogenase n=1 Tax=unclassified Conexibacter TaxID=2627773 RepID=UPI0027187677|nr:MULTISPECIES: alcohol dehydrogenase catalytic domain-containing protein [unclassified Conexibacter]MDO8187880.1 alcohol dehydrogenase catalytic domain-containing protein [Conexibacter sp. CPCC 205706]MDO8201232.1 alcohol dehydrogenase catalytic domain-containing protein [Conexibacter sp. CPCC 205762]MDR9369756.1 alcohol dehydrogenase catalytic domain-containing protein [Conexibacter sp. JD483]
MQAIVYTAPLTLELQDVPEPVAGDGEVLVEVRAVGICGSELEGFKSQSPFRVPPLIMGHELAGVRLDTGEAVAVNPLISCGRCDLCLRGEANLCRTRALLGVHRAGGFAERVAVPERCLHPAGDLSPERAALAEPLANAFHALRLAQRHDPQPQRVGVIGAGTLGLASALVAKHLGVPEVIVCDLSDDRLATAARAGITAERELTGEFDVVVDAVGSAGTRRIAAERLRPGGSAVWIGLHEPDAGFDGLALVRAEQRVLGTFAYVDRDFRAALALLPSLPTEWVTSVPLREGVEAFMELVDGPGAAAKTLLVV